MKLTNRHFDPLAARRAAEIDEVIEAVAQFAGPRPTKVDVMFESLLLGYAALATRKGEKRTVLLGQTAYDRAKDSGLLSWCREQYPDLVFEPPTKVVRGCHAGPVILDELAEFPAADEHLIGMIEKP